MYMYCIVQWSVQPQPQVRNTEYRVATDRDYRDRLRRARSLHLRSAARCYLHYTARDRSFMYGYIFERSQITRTFQFNFTCLLRYLGWFRVQLLFNLFQFGPFNFKLLFIQQPVLKFFSNAITKRNKKISTHRVYSTILQNNYRQKFNNNLKTKGFKIRAQKIQWFKTMLSS